MKTTQKGFTLIELMIVIAIIAILAAIAIPQYQNYAKRAKVSEGIVLADAAKLAVTETYQTTGDWPTTNGAAGYQTGTSTYVTSIVIGSGANSTPGGITITYQHIADDIDGQTLYLTPTASTGAIQWSCNNAQFGSAGNLPTKYVPATCRAQ